MQSTKEKVSYCIGFETARNLRQQFADMDFQCLMDGLQDVLHEEAPKLPLEEIQSILTSLKRQIEMQQRQHYTQVASDNKRHGENYLAENREKEDVVVLPSGLQYKVLGSGPAEAPHPTLLDTVTIHYRGSFIDGRIFDSSYQRGQPVALPVNRSILGWSEALQKMKVGDKWQVFVPSYLAYGEAGFGQEIGPNVTLVFEIELLGINLN
jgi:FKBP-type peptidyl-prolyl cis-trans isomerase FklB